MSGQTIRIVSPDPIIIIANPCIDPFNKHNLKVQYRLKGRSTGVM